MADAYWISNVGDIEIVGGATFMRDVYEGEEYVPAEDNDFEDNQYSQLAGMVNDPEWDAISDVNISLVEKKEYEEVLGGLWADDDSEMGAPFFGRSYKNPHQAFIDASLAKMQAYQTGTPEYRAEIERIWDNRKRGKSGIFASIGEGLGTIGSGLVSVGGDIVHVMNQAVQLPGRAIGATLGKIPIIGEPITAAVNLSPEKALGGLTTRVLRGERIDRAFLATGKAQLKAAKTLAPYVQTVVSFVPGVGTGVAAAIAAGTAIAEGRTITDAVLSGVKGALPGGAAAAAAFDTAVAITKGDRIDKAAIGALKQQLPAGAREAVDIVEGVARGKSIPEAALKAAKRRLPPQARAAVDTAIDAAKGKPINAKDMLLQVARAELPPEARKAFETGTAMGAARTIQSKIVSSSASKKNISKLARHGSKILAKGPRGLKRAAKGLSRNRKAGFMAGLGAISKRGQNSHALAAMRTRLGATQRKGFDHALKTVVEKSKGGSKNWASLVIRGRVLRGHWVAARPRSRNAVYGRLVKGRKSKTGWFRRV